MIYGLTLENIKQGMVAKRNPIILNALDKADYIENYATGIRRIFDEYAGFEKQPDFYISDSGVIVTLYNRNYHLENDGQNVGQNDGQNVGQKMKPEQRQSYILELVSSNKRLTVEDLSKVLNVSKKTVERDIDKLKRNHLIAYVGSSKDGYWEVMKAKDL